MKGVLAHLSLFSGIGGLDLAAEWAGFTTVGQCEFADFPTKVLEKHWPDVPRWRDIRTLTKESFYERTGLRTVDIISGGFPCQPFSMAGQRRGKEDERHLWPEMLRVIKELRPAWVVGENVAGLVSMVESSLPFRVESRIVNRMPAEDHYEAILSQQENMLLIEFIKDFENIRYQVRPFIIPACAAGATHKRARIFLVANADGDELPSKRRKDKSITKRNEIFLQQSNAHEGDHNRINRCHYSTRDKGWNDTGSWWRAEPDVGRVAHGIPNGMDRLKCLGNAVVPQQAYPIFAAIAQIQREIEGGAK